MQNDYILLATTVTTLLYYNNHNSPGEKTIFITEGPLKGDLAHALSGRTFGCVPGANQYANLPPFLQEMKQTSTQSVYEAYDMDKLLKTACRGDYNEKCVHCENYRRDQKRQDISCEKKCVKRQEYPAGLPETHTGLP